ncbi:MAG: hypothetical protein U0528_06565 [Anaerolineae bacterium]
MDIATAIQKLEVEWEMVEGEGFFGQLKYGYFFDEDGFQRVQKILNSVEIPEGELLDKRFVEVTWFIPIFLLWQRPAWVQDRKDTEPLDRAIDYFSGRLTTILGLP